MNEIFRPGKAFKSGNHYYADRKEYIIDPYDASVTRVKRLIEEKAVCCPFILKDLQNVTIDLNGAVLRFNGGCLPFVLENCKNITLRNFTIDYRRAPYTQFEMLEADEDHVALKLCEGFDCIRRGNELIPVDGAYEYEMHSGDLLLQPFDAITRAPSYNGWCILAVIGDEGKAGENPPMPIQHLKSEIREDGTVVWYGKFPKTWRRGQMLAVAHESRACPGIYCCDCENTVVEHVRMKRVAGFGIHGFFCKDFTVRGLVIKTDDDSNELVSINADAVHQIGLSGKLVMEDCVFENMLDDGGNFHNYFVPVEKTENNTVTVSFRFPGGCALAWHRIFRPGQRLTVYHKNTIRVKGHVKVEKITYDDERYCAEMILKGDVQCVEAGDHLENHEAAPEIEIRRCRTGRNRPRGFLISTWRKTLIEGCHFTSSSCAIHFTGDTEYWFESGYVSDVTIRNNIFENCCYNGGDASIIASPTFTSVPDEKYYHRGIKILDNLFISFIDTAAKFSYTKDVIYKGNRFIHSGTYPYRGKAPRIITEQCDNIQTEEDEL